MVRISVCGRLVSSEKCRRERLEGGMRDANGQGARLPPGRHSYMVAAEDKRDAMLDDLVPLLLRARRALVRKEVVGWWWNDGYMQALLSGVPRMEIWCGVTDRPGLWRGDSAELERGGIRARVLFCGRWGEEGGGRGVGRSKYRPRRVGSPSHSPQFCSFSLNKLSGAGGKQGGGRECRSSC